MSMILTTTHIIENQPVAAYKGVVMGQAIASRNFVVVFMDRLRAMFGINERGSQQRSIEATQEALQQLEQEARNLGADAVVGMKIDYSAFGTGNTSIMIVATGTAVCL